VEVEWSGVEWMVVEPGGMKEEEEEERKNEPFPSTWQLEP